MKERTKCLITQNTRTSWFNWKNIGEGAEVSYIVPTYTGGLSG